MKIQILLLGILMLTVAQATGLTETYVTEAAIIETSADPVIDGSSFTATPEVERDYSIPYGFTGESIDFAVNVRDDNGASDITTVELILSDDTTISQDDTVIPMSHSGDVDVNTATFIGTLTMSSSSGLKHAFVNATDSTDSIASNNGISVGEVFENPLSGFEIKDGSGNSITSISFPASSPGTKDVPSDLNTVQIINNDPDGVGMKIKVSVIGTAMINGTNEIAISNMKVDGIQLSGILTPIDDAIGDEPASHNFNLDYPEELPTGTYKGTIDFQVEAI